MKLVPLKAHWYHQPQHPSICDSNPPPPSYWKGPGRVVLVSGEDACGDIFEMLRGSFSGFKTKGKQFENGSSVQGSRVLAAEGGV